MSRAVSLKEVVPADAPLPEVGTPAKRYLVELTYDRPREVAAATPEEAWDEYRRLEGILISQYKPRITEITPKE